MGDIILLNLLGVFFQQYKAVQFINKCIVYFSLSAFQLLAKIPSLQGLLCSFILLLMSELAQTSIVRFYWVLSHLLY